MLAGGAYTVFAPGAPGAGQPAADRRRRRGQGAVRRELHHLPRPQRPGRRGPRPEPDRRRRGLGRVPGQHRPDAAGPPGGPGASASRRSSPTSRPVSSAQYIQELGGGPSRARGRRPRARTATSPPAVSCSGSTARSATPSVAAAARSPRASSPRACTPRPTAQIYAAMLSGPQNMPVFGDNQLTPEQKADIIAYIQETLKHDQDPGGVQPRPVRPGPPRAWRSSWSASWRWSSPACGLRGSHDRAVSDQCCGAARRHRSEVTA